MKEYEVRWRDGKEKGTKKMLLEELTLSEMQEVNVLFGELDLEDKGETVANILAMNLRISKKEFYPKLCAIILHEESGDRCDEKFFNSCYSKDLEAPTTDFFTGEGSFIASGIAGIILSPLLKGLQTKS